MESWKADEKQIDEVKSEDEVESEERRCNSAKVRRKKSHPRQMFREVAKCCVFPMIRVSGESKSKLVKAAGAEACGQRRNQKLHAAVARSTFSIKMCFSLHVRATFWSYDVEKLHAAVARSTFWSENVQNMSASEHFLKLRCWKIARRCGEKHISKSKC